MDNIWIASFVVGGFIAAVLTILLLRGRFGTPAQQGRYELHELASSKAVPRNAIMKGMATCRGHDVPTRVQLFGSGILWLNHEMLGFVLFTPRRHIDVPLSKIEDVEQATVYRRPGVEETSEDGKFLVIHWQELDGGPESVCFHVDEPEPWIRAIELARAPRR